MSQFICLTAAWLTPALTDERAKIMTSCLAPSATLFLSGLQHGDIALVRLAAEASRLKCLKTEICGEWVLLLFEKSAV
ncbi:MAG: hypothetical protein O3B82_02770 [Bacteroidetes bacterium]|nr:hypothetical protein [Bacteroidota bacterium]